jgi:hypothetical protein
MDNESKEKTKIKLNKIKIISGYFFEEIKNKRKLNNEYK